MTGRGWILLLVITVIAGGAGCGSSGRASASRHAASRAGGRSHANSGSTPGAAGAGAIPAPSPTGIPANPVAVAVIRAWSDALRRGDVARAAAYFAVPSLMINGPDANGNAIIIRIRSRAQARAANLTLPCGARFISADQRGRFVNALFRLTNRPGPGGGCGGGTGQTARTNFVITARRIVEWIRAPDDPGDNASPAQPSAPPNSTTAGPAV